MVMKMKPITKKIASFAMAFTLLGAGAIVIPQSPLTLTASAGSSWDYTEYAVPKPNTNYGMYYWCVSHAEEVKFIQALCNAGGYRDDCGRTLVVDGWYGGNTAAAVRKLQSANGLTPDGVFGPNTRARVISPHMRGEDYA